VPAAIETRGLTKYYGDHPGVLDVDLEVPVGSAFGFLGPNGAGKTTTIRLLLDLLRPTRGSATVLGLDSRREAVAAHARLGYLPGDLALHEDLTAREHLRWLGRLRGGVADARIEELAGRLELSLDRRIGALSRGNRQKVGLVQAFVHEPDLLILDEPTSGLDPLVQHTFHELVREVVSAGRTVFVSSHGLAEVQTMCDRVGMVRAGRLVAVEHVTTLREHALRNVAVRFADDVPPELARLPGVHDLRIEPPRATFRLEGDVDPLLKALARHRVLDLQITPASLEDVFLRFYRDGRDAR
jgi:ABC-2 type transport system ATP-binding protein